MTNDRGLVDYSALALRDLIATGKVSPIEVLEAHLEEIARLNPSLNAVVKLFSVGDVLSPEKSAPETWSAVTLPPLVPVTR